MDRHDAAGAQRELSRGTLAVLAGTGDASLAAGAAGARLLWADAQPIGEQVARHGPFVMNTRAEIMQAFDDFSRGRLDRAPA